jgi:hypothetical protein
MSDGLIVEIGNVDSLVNKDNLVLDLCHVFFKSPLLLVRLFFKLHFIWGLWI